MKNICQVRNKTPNFNDCRTMKKTSISLMGEAKIFFPLLRLIIKSFDVFLDFSRMNTGQLKKIQRISFR